MKKADEYLRCRVVSTAHLTSLDNELLDEISSRRDEWGPGEWIHYIGFGYIIRLTASSNPVLRLKAEGLSKGVRRLIISLMKHDAVELLIFESGAPQVDGFEVNDW